MLHLIKASDAPILLVIASLPRESRTPRVISEKVGKSYNHILSKITGYKYRGYLTSTRLGQRTMYSVPVRGALFRALELHYNIDPIDSVTKFEHYMEKFKNGK